MPEKDQFLMPQNTQNIAPVQAGTLFSPEPRTTKKWQKWCQMVPKSDAEPSKRPSGNMFEIALKYPTQKKQKCLQRAPQRYPKETPKSSKNEPWGPPGPPMAPQSGPRCPTEPFCSILGHILPYFLAWRAVTRKQLWLILEPIFPILVAGNRNKSL